MRWFVIFALALAGSNGGSDAAWSASASADALANVPELPVVLLSDSENSGSTPIRIGDTLRFNVAEPLQGRKLVQPDSKVVLESGWDIQIGSDGSIEAIPVRAGSLSLPRLEVQDAEGRVVARTRALALEVAADPAVQTSGSVPGQATGDQKAQTPEPPLPPVSLRIPAWVKGLAGSLALLVLALVGYLVYRVIQRRRAGRPLPAPAPAPRRSEDEIALAALDTVERSGWLNGGQHKRHYFGVSEALKKFLGDRFDFDAAESTTGELLGQLQDRAAFGKDAIESVRALFLLLDRVKFTDFQPDLTEGKHVLDEARRIVLRHRRPKPVVAGGPIIETRPSGLVDSAGPAGSGGGKANAI